MKDLSKEEIEKLLLTERFGMLALTDGFKPYCIPFGFAYTNNFLYISFFEKGRKWGYLQANSNACFCVYKLLDEVGRGWASVVVDGKLAKVTDLEEIRLLLEAYVKKYGGDPKYVEERLDYYKRSESKTSGVKVYKIEISKMSGKKSQGEEH